MSWKDGDKFFAKADASKWEPMSDYAWSTSRTKTITHYELALYRNTHVFKGAAVTARVSAGRTQLDLARFTEIAVVGNAMGDTEDRYFCGTLIVPHMTSNKANVHFPQGHSEQYDFEVVGIPDIYRLSFNSWFVDLSNDKLKMRAEVSVPLHYRRGTPLLLWRSKRLVQVIVVGHERAEFITWHHVLHENRIVPIRLNLFNHCRQYFLTLGDYKKQLQEYYRIVQKRYRQQTIKTSFDGIKSGADDAESLAKFIINNMNECEDPQGCQDRQEGQVKTLRLLLCGHAGQGKTWFAMQLLLEIAKHSETELTKKVDHPKQSEEELTKKVNRPQISSQSGCQSQRPVIKAKGPTEGGDGGETEAIGLSSPPCLPVLVVIKELFKMVDSNETVTIDWLLEYCQKFVLSSYNKDGHNKLLRQAFQMRTVVLVLDGLDEVDAKRLLPFLDELVYRGMWVVATSRRSFIPSFQVRNLRYLDDAQLCKLLRSRKENGRLPPDSMGNHLLKFTGVRRKYDELWQKISDPESEDPQALRELREKFAKVSEKRHMFDLERGVRINPEAPQSKYLIECDKEIKQAFKEAEGGRKRRLKVKDLYGQLQRLHENQLRRNPEQNQAERDSDGLQKLWHRIMQRTDEIYLAAERHGVPCRFEAVEVNEKEVVRQKCPLAKMLTEVRDDLRNQNCCATPERASKCCQIVLAPIKTPVRIAEKVWNWSKNEEAEEELLEARVFDVIRARVTCECLSCLYKYTELLSRHPHVTIEQFKDKFHNLDPSHLRFFLLNLTFQETSSVPEMLVEVQIHNKQIHQVSESEKSHVSYEFFCNKLNNWTEDMDPLLVRMLDYVASAQGVPGKLNLLLHLFEDKSLKDDDFLKLDSDFQLHQLYVEHLVAPLSDDQTQILGFLAAHCMMNKEGTFAQSEIIKAVAGKRKEAWDDILQLDMSPVTQFDPHRQGMRHGPQTYNFWDQSSQAAFCAGFLRTQGDVAAKFFAGDRLATVLKDADNELIYAMGGKQLGAVIQSHINEGLESFEPDDRMWKVLTDHLRLQSATLLKEAKKLRRIDLKHCDFGGSVKETVKELLTSLPDQVQLDSLLIPLLDGGAKEVVWETICKHTSTLDSLEIGDWSPQETHGCGEYTLEKTAVPKESILKNTETKEEYSLPQNVQANELTVFVIAKLYRALRTLHIEAGNAISAEGVQCIIQHCTSLESLEIGANNQIGNGGINHLKRLVNACGAVNTLKKLVIAENGNELEDSGELEHYFCSRGLDFNGKTAPYDRQWYQEGGWKGDKVDSPKIKMRCSISGKGGLFKEVVKVQAK